MKTRLLLLVFVIISTSFTRKPIGDAEADKLKLNQIQIIASHNSYHLTTDAAVLRFLKFIYGIGVLPKDLDPKQIDYTKDSLSVQLGRYSVRGLELDVWNDPEGGNFYFRKGKAYALKPQASHIEALKKPGFKILHIPDFDFNSTNNTLVDALMEIKRWSDANPTHLPVFINIETETSAPGDQIHAIRDLAHAVPFDSVAADELDAEVKSVFGKDLSGVLTPDMVRGNYATLEQAVLAGNWPTLAKTRGKVMFIIDANSSSGDVYKSGHPSLQGRAMFVYSNPGTPEAAFVILNNPVPDFERIQNCVKQGYIVRTRSDDGTLQARSGDSTDLKAAYNSWAQIISTDYYKPDRRAGEKGWSNFCVTFPNGAIARVNMLSAPKTDSIEYLMY